MDNKLKFDFKEKMFNSISIVLFSIDKDGNLLFFNRGYEIGLGYTAKNISDKFINPSFERIKEISREGVFFKGIITFKSDEKFNNSFITEISKIEDEILFFCEKDANEIEHLYKEMSEIQLRINNINRELLKKEVILKNTVEKLEETNKKLIKISEDKSKILGIVAHDLRGPIGAVYGLSELTYESLEEIKNKNNIKDKEMEENIEYIKIIMNSTEFTLNLIDSVLNISTIETGEMKLNIEKINYNEFINKTLKIYKEIAKRKKINLEAEYKIDNELFIEADIIKITQVINNFLQNAVKFSYPNSNIRVLIKEEDEFIITEVKDEGQGIPETEKEKLFKMFSMTKVRSTGGEKSSGLGLYISKHIIEAHKGEIGYRNNEDKGCTFYYKLKKI